MGGLDIHKEGWVANNMHGIGPLKPKLAILGLAVLSALAVLPITRSMGQQQQPPSVVGLWQKVDDDTKKPLIWFLFADVGGGVFEGYAAKVYAQPGDEPNPVCVHCTDDRRGMPLLGLPMIRGMKRNGLRYENGTVLDPRDGKVYSAVMTHDPGKGTLTLRGYLGFEFLGKNDVWYRVPDSGFKEVDPAILAKYAPERAEGKKGKAKASTR
jgi:uncharacterized protein (DUF2147 family)